MSCVTAGFVIEQIALWDFNVCYGVLHACFAGDLLGKFASERIKSTWLGPMSAVTMDTKDYPGKSS